MRKRVWKLLLVTMMAVVLSACGNNESKVNQVIQNQMQESDGKNSQNEDTPEISKKAQKGTEAETKKSQTVANESVDVDLTKLSSTMVYSEVYNMMYSPKSYVGKTVKMSGTFVVYTNQDESLFYPAVVIADATACCSQGLEFILEGNPSYPDGYPEMDTEITVIGVFETYKEGNDIYCRLKDAKIA